MDIFRIIGKLASLSIIFGMITFIAEIPQRAEQQATERKRANYEAWQLIRAKLSYI
jgi:preprotein translocase subunit YajC